MPAIELCPPHSKNYSSTISTFTSGTQLIMNEFHRWHPKPSLLHHLHLKTPMAAQTKLAVFPAVDTYSAPTTPHDSGWRTGMRGHDILRLSCLLALAFFCFSPSIRMLHRHDGFSSDVSPPLGLPKDVQISWGQYSPYFPASTYQPPPVGCDIIQVNIVSLYPPTNLVRRSL